MVLMLHIEIKFGLFTLLSVSIEFPKSTPRTKLKDTLQYPVPSS